MVYLRSRVAGWVFLGLTVVVITIVVSIGALRAHGAAEFNRWVGWATVLGLPLAAVGVVLTLRDRITAGPELRVRETEDELSAVVLRQAHIVRSRLLGVGELGDVAANVQYVKGTGRFREAGGGERGDLATVVEFFQSLWPRRLVILGEPGAGKTVLAMELLVGLLERRHHDPSIPVPVLVSAATYDTNQTWEGWLADQLTQQFNMPAEAATGLVRDRQILPVVDGLDEMDVADESERARTLVKALNSFMRGRDRAPVVVTCRQKEYQVFGASVDKATHIEMVPLTGRESAAYLSSQLRGTAEERAWEPVFADLSANPAGALASQLATPWRLKLSLTAFRGGGDPAELLPARPRLTGAAAYKYAQHVESLLMDSYVTSALYLHDPARRYSPQQVRQWLIALAKGLDWQAHHNGSATDIQLDRWWRSSGRHATQGVHVALAAAPSLICLAVGANTGNQVVVVAGWVLLACALNAVRPPHPNRLRIRGLDTRRGRHNLAVGLVGGFALGLVLGLSLSLSLSLGLASGITFGLASGAAFGLAGGSIFGLRDTSPQAVGPHDLIRADGRYGFVGGLALGLATALAYGLVNGLLTGCAVGLAVGLTFALAFGADAWTRYQVSVVINAASRKGPLHFDAFLNWAHQAELLRVYGIAYQFQHRQLQDWLTTRKRREGELQDWLLSHRSLRHRD